MTWLVTGGAGYIGSHVVRAFRQVGLDVVVLDDLSSGHREFVPADVPFVDGSVLDVDLVRGVLAEHGVEGAAIAVDTDGTNPSGRQTLCISVCQPRLRKLLHRDLARCSESSSCQIRASLGDERSSVGKRRERPSYLATLAASGGDVEDRSVAGAFLRLDQPDRLVPSRLWDSRHCLAPRVSSGRACEA